jgi:hypothetical protein
LVDKELGMFKTIGGGKVRKLGFMAALSRKMFKAADKSKKDGYTSDLKGDMRLTCITAVSSAVL